MAQFLMVHTMDPKMWAGDGLINFARAMVAAFTADTYCITSWAWGAGAKIVCLWEAPSEQAILDLSAKVPPIPVDGIYPAMVVDWAEMKKMLAGG